MNTLCMYVCDDMHAHFNIGSDNASGILGKEVGQVTTDVNGGAGKGCHADHSLFEVLGARIRSVHMIDRTQTIPVVLSIRTSDASFSINQQIVLLSCRFSERKQLLWLASSPRVVSDVSRRRLTSLRACLHAAGFHRCKAVSTSHCGSPSVSPQVERFHNWRHAGANKP